MDADDRLADEWEAGVLGRSVSHEEHVRIARTLVRRHGREDATRRLVEGTRRNCEVMGSPERFDGALTARWSARIADSVETDPGDSFEDFMQLHPDLQRSDLLGPPSWKAQERRGG